MAHIAIGTKDKCLHCDKPIVYGNWRFWKDDKTPNPVSGDPKNPFPYGMYKEESELTESEKKQIDTFKVWQEIQARRGVLWVPYQDVSDWLSYLKWPLESFEDLSRDCQPPADEEGVIRSRRNHAPSGLCNETTNSGDKCFRKVKEVVSIGGRLRPMCGIHYGIHKREEEASKDAQVSQQLNEWAEKEMERFSEELKELGIDAHPEWQRHVSGRIAGSYTGFMAVDPEQLLEILRKHAKAKAKQ